MAVANQTPASVASEFATIQFIVQQLLNSKATAALVRVQACTNTGDVIAPGTVDLQLLTDQITEDGQTIPHGTVFKAPYMRVQGGANAVILDPSPGDLGVCVFAMRDISPIKSNPQAALDRAPVPGAPPGSRRTYDFSDALYLGGMLNGIPTQYVRFAADGITIVSPVAVTIQAPTINLKGAVMQTDGAVSISDMAEITGNVSITGSLSVTGDVTGEGTSLHTHTHPDPQGGNTGPPNP